MSYDGQWETVRVELGDGIAWVELNRPDKRNAMNPRLNAEMVEALEALDAGAIWPSPRTTQRSACPRSTGEFHRAAWSTGRSPRRWDRVWRCSM
jgi:hypothetical protein